MGGKLTVTTRIVEDPPDLSHGPHYEGPASVLRIPSERFYAVTGFPLKEKGSVPANLIYLESGKIAGLSNLSGDINLAARNALAAIIDYIMTEYGYDQTQAYVITAILPLDIFVERE